MEVYSRKLKLVIYLLLLIFIIFPVSVHAESVAHNYFQNRDSASDTAGGSPFSTENMLRSIGETTQTDGSRLTSTLEGFNSGMYSLSSSILETVAKPVGYTILALFLLLELYEITVSRESLNGETGVMLPFKLMFKAVLCKIVLDMSATIMLAIYDVALYITQKASSLVSTSDVGLATDAIDSMVRAIDSLGMVDRMQAWVIVLLVWLATKLAYLFAQVVIIGRFITIFVMLAVAPLPLATLPSAEHSQIAKSFLKRFIAECLQGFIIYLVLCFFPLMFSVGSDATDVTGWLMNALFNAALLVVAIRTTSGLSKAVCNAM